MGIQKSGPFGPFYKKTGPIIGRRSKKGNVITGLHHPSTKAATEDQVDSQDKFVLLNGFLNKLKLLVRLGFKAYSKECSALNAAFSYNYPHAFISVDAELQIDFPRIVYSRGKIQGVSVSQLSRQGLSLTVAWLNDHQSDYCQFTDLGTLVVYNEDRGLAMTYPNAMRRKDLGYVAELPRDFVSARLHCYMDFSSADGKLRGDSRYIGRII